MIKRYYISEENLSFAFVEDRYEEVKEYIRYGDYVTLDLPDMTMTVKRENGNSKLYDLSREEMDRIYNELSECSDVIDCTMLDGSLYIKVKKS